MYLSEHFLPACREAISDTATDPDPAAYGGDWTIQGFEDHGTSHLAVVDSERNAVALTTTINTAFGAKVMSASTGWARPAAPPQATSEEGLHVPLFASHARQLEGMGVS